MDSQKRFIISDEVGQFNGHLDLAVMHKIKIISIISLLIEDIASVQLDRLELMNN